MISIIALFFAIYLFTTNKKTNNQNETTSTLPIITPTDSLKSNEIQGPKTLTIIEVKRHNFSSDCWTIIKGNVYDITDYITTHPGGNVIEQACGKDGTTLFTERKNSNNEIVGNGTPHSINAQKQLEKYYLGPLQK